MVEGMLWEHERVCSSQTSCTYMGWHVLRLASVICNHVEVSSILTRSTYLFRDVIQLAEI
jgi:hypothetical protein